MSSSPVVELEGWRLNQIRGLSLLATVPVSVPVVVSLVASSLVSPLVVESEVVLSEVVLSEVVSPVQAARLNAMAAARVSASAFLIAFSPLLWD